VRVWSTCKVKSFEEWPTQVDRYPLNKSIRHMEEFGKVDSMMKLCDAGGTNQNCP
jgi:hypothetical protein